MITKTQANRLRGLIAHQSQCQRALWALNSDNRNGVDFGTAYRKKVMGDLEHATDKLNAHIRTLTEVKPK